MSHHSGSASKTTTLTGEQNAPLKCLYKDELLVMRTPCWPLALATKLFSENDPGSLQELLRENEPFKIAVFLSSSSLWSALTGASKTNATAWLRLAAYAVRMASRCTPFGLFAAISEVKIGSRTTLKLSELDQVRAHPRLDMEIASKALQIAALPENAPSVALLRNPLRRKIGEPATAPIHARDSGDGCVVKASAATFEADPLNAYFKDGMSADQLVRTLYQNGVDDAQTLVRRALSDGVLVHAMRPSPTANAEKMLVKRLEHVASDFVTSCADALQRIDNLARKPLGQHTIGEYTAIDSMLRTVATARATLQVDSYRDAQGTLGANVIDDARALGELCLRNGSKPVLSEYLSRFYRKYESFERAIPLLELTDSDKGIGVPQRIEMRPNERSPKSHLLVASLLAGALAANANEIVISDSDVQTLYPPLPRSEDLPDSFEIGFEVAAHSIRDIDDGNYLVAPAPVAFTDAAAKSVGRFCHIFSSDLPRRIRNIYDRLNPPDAIDVELCYLPSSLRSANVCLRPQLSEYEIHAGCDGLESKATEIPLSDIYVTVRDGYLALWSASFAKWLRVRETHMLNPWLAPGFVRLLTFVARCGKGSFVSGGFNWGAMSAMPYLPRVRTGRLVLSRARWLLDAEQLKRGADDLSAYIRHMQSTYGMPQYGYLAESDNKLFLDLRSGLGRDMLRDQVRRSAKQYVVFQEVLPDADSVWVQSESGRHNAEFILSCARVAPRSKWMSDETANVTSLPIQRSSPGTEWVYLKLYCGNERSVTLLARDMPEIVMRLREEYGLALWFYVRFADPLPHVRLRLKFASRADAARALHAVLSWGEELVERSVIDRFALDTYSRECERYGGDTAIPFVERLFCVDSELALRTFQGPASVSREQRAIASIWSFDGFLRGIMGRKIHAYFDAPPRRRSLTPLDWTHVKHIAKGLRVMNDMDVPVSIRDAAENIRQLEARGGLTAHRSAIVSSLFHMHCNRLAIGLQDETRVRLWQREAYKQLQHIKERAG